MKKIRRVLAFVLSFVMVFLLFSISVAGAAGKTGENTDYEENFKEYLDKMTGGRIHETGYTYDELYRRDKRGECEHSYILVKADTDLPKPEPIINAMHKDRVIQNGEIGFPFEFGYGIYDIDKNEFFDLIDVWEDEETYPDINGILELLDIGWLIGDLDGDNLLSIADATVLQQCLAKLRSFPVYDELGGGFRLGNAYYVSDHNMDHERDIADATSIQRQLAGITLDKEVPFTLFDEISYPYTEKRITDSPVLRVCRNRNDVGAAFVDIFGGDIPVITEPEPYYTVDLSDSGDGQFEIAEDFFDKNAAVVIGHIVGGMNCSEAVSRLVKSGSVLNIYSDIRCTDAWADPANNYQITVLKVDKDDVSNITQIETHEKFVHYYSDKYIYSDRLEKTDFPDNNSINFVTLLTAQNRYLDYNFGLGLDNDMRVALIKSREEFSALFRTYDDENFPEEFFENNALVVGLAQMYVYESFAKFERIAVSGDTLYADFDFGVEDAEYYGPTVPLINVICKVKKADIENVKNIIVV